MFGPDGMLWIGLGDGGGGGDPQGNAQSLGTLLGKMLRIDPRPSGGRPYTVPPDNPFVGTDGARGEIWAFGLRNPWRYTFDKATGDLWIGDVGQNAREEVDFTPAGSPGGLNYGWPNLEGNRTNSGSAPRGAVAPILDYPLDGANCAVTAGYVYRGTKIPDLAGAFLYADVCAGWVRAVRQEGGKVTDQADLDLQLTATGLLRPGRRRRALRALPRRRCLPHRPCVSSGDRRRPSRCNPSGATRPTSGPMACARRERRYRAVRRR